MRAEFHAGLGWGTFQECLDYLARMDNSLARFQEHDEIILWLEHDLFDQLILIRLLDWFAQHDLEHTKLSLICIGEFSGVDRFIGLGQLTPDQLATLYGTQHEVTAAEIALARAAWAAFCAPDPTAIESVIQGDTSALLFLRDALLRHLEEFPSIKNGLARSEEQILTVIAAGAQQAMDVFRAAQDKEERPYLGDTTIWTHLNRLADGREPLLQNADDMGFSRPVGLGPYSDDFGAQRVSLTATGKAVLEGTADYIEINGIDRWLGGVHLRDSGTLWRWDASRLRLIAHDKLASR